MAILHELQNLGLTDKEAKVYLANLELGESSVQNIGKKAGVNRATTYVILEQLLHKGLCSIFEKDKKTFYVALEPENLESLFELQQKELEEKKKRFRQVLPEIKLLNNRSKEKPVVRFYEGKQGLINCLSDFFVFRAANKSDDNISRLLYSKDKIDHFFSPQELNKFRDVRLAQDVKIKTLYNSEKITLEDTKDGIRVKVSGKDYPFACGIGIHGDSVRILTLGEKLSGILITNADVARTLKSLFELAWKAAEGQSKKAKN